MEIIRRQLVLATTPGATLDELMEKEKTAKKLEGEKKLKQSLKIQKEE